MLLTVFRSSVSLSISILGTLLIGTGFFYPFYTISPPINTNFSNPYPPVVNGWQVISSPLVTDPAIVFVLGAAVLLFCTSLLLLFREGARRASTIRLLLSFVCIALLVFVILDAMLINFAGSPDGAAASPTFTVGQGFWMVLLGLALCGLGAGSASIGALIGTCLGIVIGYFLTLGFGALLNFLSQTNIPGMKAFLSLVFPGIALWPSIAILGSILGGWLFRKIQTWFRQIDDDLSGDPGTTQRIGA